MPDDTPKPTITEPGWMSRNWKWIALGLSLAGWLIAAIQAIHSGQPIPPPPPLIVENGDNGAPPLVGNHVRYATGWIRDDDAVQAVVNDIRHPVFAATPAGQVETVPDHVYLWDVARDAIGANIPTRDQGSVGSCVSFGAACAVEYSQCVAMVAAKKAGRPPPEFKAVSQEVIYGGSRVQIGGGRIRGDGSVGAWAAQWCEKFGSVGRGVYGDINLETYSESRCRSYGARGCPDELIPEAKKHLTRTISQVRTTDELKKALTSAYPVTVASDVGFGQRGPYVRNAKGQLRASGTWAHQMCFIGFDKDSGFLCMNSWGPTWVSGPSGPGNPPPGSFYIDERTAQRMLDQNDSWAFGDQQGFPARKLDWFVNHVRPERDRLNLFARGEFALAP